jgi:hypothetical protein
MVPLGADALIMRGGTHDAILSMLRTLGGTTPEHVTLPGTGREQNGGRALTVPAYRGVPIIVNDFLPGNEVPGNLRRQHLLDLRGSLQRVATACTVCSVVRRGYPRSAHRHAADEGRRALPSEVVLRHRAEEHEVARPPVRPRQHLTCVHA